MSTRYDHIRSYVIRQTRMSKHQREAFERLYPVYGVALTEQPTAWSEVFGNDNPVIVEIGFGMGEALIEVASRRPNHNLFGIEVHKPGLGKALGRIEREGISNVRVIREDAVTVFRQMIAPGSLAGIHVFFPDPWPKKRHHKRRLIKPGFPELVTPALQPGGYLYVATDWDNYAEQISEILGNAPNLIRESVEAVGGRPETEFERKGRALEHTIHELYYRAVSPRLPD